MEPVQTQLQFKPLFDFEYLIWTRIEFAQTLLQLQRPNLEFKWVPVQSQSLTSFGFKLNVFNIQLKTFICLWSFTLVWKGTHSSTFSVLIFSRLKWSWTQSFAAANKRHWWEKKWRFNFCCCYHPTEIQLSETESPQTILGNAFGGRPCVTFAFRRQDAKIAWPRQMMDVWPVQPLITSTWTADLFIVWSTFINFNIFLKNENNTKQSE